MPRGKTFGNKIRPGGWNHIQRFTTPESELAKFLYPLAWRDTIFVFDDFTGPALSTHMWTAGGVNGTNFDPPATQLVGGVCQGVTGTTSSDQNSIRSDAVWLGDNNCGMEIRWKIDDITTCQFETGFNDPLTSYAATDGTSAAVNDIDTPTIQGGATDVALIARDTSQTLTTMAFITDGSTSNMNTTKTNLGTRTPTNATYITTRVQLAQTAAAVAASHAYVLSNVNALQEEAQHGAVLASQIKGNVLLEARFYIETLTTAARTVDIDYIAVWQDRVAEL